MHENDRKAEARYSREASGIVGEGRDVVYQAGTGIRCTCHHRGVSGVDRNRDAGPPRHRLDHRKNAALLLVYADGLRTGPGQLAADVEDIGAFRLQLQCVGDRGAGIQKLAAVGKAVGRHIDDAHDEWTREIAAGDSRARAFEPLHDRLQPGMGGRKEFTGCHKPAVYVRRIPLDQLGGGERQFRPPADPEAPVRRPCMGDAACRANVEG